MGRRVTVHCFERSVELPKNMQQREYHYPLQVLIAIKERNGGKLNSHLWMFNGFAVQLNPKYLMLLDVGTVPREDSILKLYKWVAAAAAIVVAAAVAAIVAAAGTLSSCS